MYSKFGKVLTERFQILNHREEILSGKVRTMKPASSFIRYQDHPSSVDLTENFAIEDPHSEPEIPKPQHSKARSSVSFQSQSREEYYKANGSKTISPPCGLYDCKYSLVHKSIRVPKFKPRPETKSRKPHQKSKCNGHCRPARPSSKASTQKMPFELQSTRPDITSLINGVNEKRFLGFEDMPDQCSKYKRVSTPNIGKGTERKPLFSSSEYQPEYQPSFSLVTKDLGKVVLFEKYSKRKGIERSCEEDNREYKPSFKLVEKKVCSPDFRKYRSRPVSATPLPCFMMNVTWREAINTTNEKSLEMNHYIEKSIEL